MANILQIHVSLAGSEPMIWRRFKVRDDYRLDRYHQVLQIVMGWNNSHLHEFQLPERRIGMILPWDIDEPSLGPELEDETQIYLKQLDLNEGDSLGYLYDFGDNWEHLIHIEKITQGEFIVPLCLDGERAGPPDDSGGIWGYQDIIEIVKNPKHPQYEDYVMWLPEGFDPERFDIDAVNAELHKFGVWHNKHPRKKSTPWHMLE